MNKSIILTLNYYPMLINMLIITLISLPSLNNKFTPMNLILILISLTILISLKLNMLINSWGSYMLFLIIIGGLMIIFLYITSIANNETFMINYKSIMMNSIKLMPLIIIINIFMLTNFKYNQIYSIKYNLILNYNFYEMYYKFYNFNNLFLMNYLLFTMNCIMNICHKMKTPLRQLFI